MPFVRLRKQLSKRTVTLTEQDGKNSTDVAALKENTVFVIRAEALGSFLSQFQLIESRRGSAV